VPDLDISRFLLAYGPAPGVELIPYFLGLLAWVGLAFAAVIRSPISSLLRRLRRAITGQRAEPKVASTTESPGEGSYDKA
jgi:hypothetical protein